MKTMSQAFWLVATLAAGLTAAQASNVKVPLGQRTGEFCAQDRATLFEDPTGGAR